ncbi:MAG: peptidoglycan-binding protein [Deltaproteobacteria bacterium]|nr:peptidoglycan-binding protein [Deltaproteobacteria bacterium]
MARPRAALAAGAGFAVAVKGVGVGLQHAPGQQGAGTGNNLAQTLSSLGLMLPGQSMNSVIRTILKNMAPYGFTGQGQGDLGNQLKDALASMQKTYGMPAEGKLDAATVALLRQLGVVPPAPSGPAGLVDVKDGFERSSLGTSSKNAGTSAPLSKAEAESIMQQLRNFVDSNFGGSMKAFSDWVNRMVEGMRNLIGGGRDAGGGAALQGAQQSASKDAQVTVQQRADRGTPTAAAAVQGNPAAQTLTSEQQRVVNLAGLVNPTGVGVPQGQGNPHAVAGIGKNAGQEARTKVGEGDEQAKDKSKVERDGSATDDEKEDEERETGNAPSGDDEFADDRRGHAQLDLDAIAERGPYEIPTLSQQVLLALQNIFKEPEVANRATSYRWDVTFYKPGIYGAGQKAQELLHFVVEDATAFDPVWERARGELQKFLNRLEPKAKPLAKGDFEAALRRARVSDV